jgi:hypothetical protein
MHESPSVVFLHHALGWPYVLVGPAALFGPSFLHLSSSSP